VGYVWLFLFLVNPVHYFWFCKISVFFVLIFVELQPRIRGWLLASVDGQKTGIIPANYVRVLGKRRGTEHSERNLAKVNDTSPVKSERMEHDVEQEHQQAATSSTDDVWSFDDVNCW